MSTFSHHTLDSNIMRLSQDFSSLLGASILRLERHGKGSNNRVYKITSLDSKTYIGKVYFRHPKDSRDRLAVEFGALRFLSDNGIECVPKPLAADERNGLAVYEHISGQKIVLTEIHHEDINQAVNFLLRLKDLRCCPGNDQLQAASEACFSFADIIENLDYRLARLREVNKNGKPFRAMARFLEEKFVPAFEGIKHWAYTRLTEVGMRSETELKQPERTLSPSDFGFHNALRRKNGHIVWLDFEYFGWDDPAKMTADFLLHPAMNIDWAAGCLFVQGILEGFSEIIDLPWRLETVYPLFGLKWCVIMLNEFLPAAQLRRNFAEPEGVDSSQEQWGQLEKTRHMLERIIKEYEHFPYR